MHAPVIHDVARTRSLSLGSLTWAYALVPLVLLIAGFDLVVTRGCLRTALPDSPNHLLWLNVALVNPHIIASGLVFADSEYLRAYRNQILLGAAAIIGGSWLWDQLFSAQSFLIAYGFLTVNHVVGQQLGLVRGHLSTAARLFQFWKWTTLILVNACFLFLYQPGLREGSPRWIMLVGIGFLATMSFSSGLPLMRSIQTGSGRRYALANQGMIGAIVLLTATGYGFFANLLPRIIHDFTAFYAYSVHDFNRHGERGQTPLHRLWHKARFPVILATPLFALLIAFPLTAYAYIPWVSDVVICITLGHYAMESRIWRRGGLPRRYLPIVG